MKKWIMKGLLSVSWSCSAFAGAMGETAVVPAWQYVAGFSAGPAWSSPGQTQTIYFTPTFPQTYVANTRTQSFATGEVFLGLQPNYFQDFTTQLGFAVAATTAMQLKGDVWQDNDPDFNNFLYTYKVSHSHLALRGKVQKNIHQMVEPYVGASIGVGFNHAYHYEAASRIPEVAEEPPFSSHVTTAFTYTLDVGIQRHLSTHWSVGVGYEFADWGKTQLGRASDQMSGNGLLLNHVYTNELQFNITYVV